MPVDMNDWPDTAYTLASSEIPHLQQPICRDDDDALARVVQYRIFHYPLRYSRVGILFYTAVRVRVAVGWDDVLQVRRIIVRAFDVRDYELVLDDT